MTTASIGSAAAGFSAFSIRSGRTLQIPGRSEFSSMLFPWDTSGITTLSEQPGDEQSWLLARHRVLPAPINGRHETDRERWDESDQLQFEPAWSLPFKMSSRLGAGPPGQGICLDASGELKLIPWKSGLPQSLGKAGREKVSEADPEADGPVDYCVWDRIHVLSASDTSPGTTSLDCPAVPVHGSVFVFSRDRSELEWKFPFEGFLLTDTLARCPQLALIRLEDSQVAGYPYQKVQLSLVDKQSGKVVHEINTKSFGTGLSGCMFDPKMLRWGLFLQGETMRIKVNRRSSVDVSFAG